LKGKGGRADFSVVSSVLPTFEVFYMLLSVFLQVILLD